MEAILKRLGSPGRYHMLIAALITVTWFCVAFGNVSMTFYGYTPKYKCLVSHIGNNESAPFEGENFTVTADQCTIHITSNHSQTVRPCTAWLYERDDPSLETLVTEWNLVCEDKYKTALSTTLFFCGVFFGALIFGFVSDKIGRKKTLAICLYCHIPVALAIAFIPDYVWFTILRFILGIWLQGVSTVAYVYCIEFFRLKYRGLVQIGFGTCWALGQLLTALLAYSLPNWRHLQIASSLVALITVPYYWWLPESPRWLLVKGRIDEIVTVFLTRAMKVNNTYSESFKQTSKEELEELYQSQQLAASSKSSESFISLLKTPELLKRLIIMCYTWCVAALAYYVFILTTGDLAGNRYINFTIGASLEIIMNFIIVFTMNKLGRKRPLIVSCLTVAILCLICGTLPKTIGDFNTRPLITGLSLLGKVIVSSIICVIFMYAAELFPTSLRGSCMACCGSCLRLGGILAPQIATLGLYTFTELPYIIIAASIFLPVVLSLLLPETFGCAMANTLREAVQMGPNVGVQNVSLGLLQSTQNEKESTEN